MYTFHHNLANSNHTPRKLRIDVSLCTSALIIDIGPFIFKHLKTYLWSKYLLCVGVLRYLKKSLKKCFKFILVPQKYRLVDKGFFFLIKGCLKWSWSSEAAATYNSIIAEGFSVKSAFCIPHTVTALLCLIFNLVGELMT